MIDTNELRKIASLTEPPLKNVFLAVGEDAAQFLSDKLGEAAKTIDLLKDGISDFTDATVEQRLLDNIEFILDSPRPQLNGLNKIYSAVIAYKEFQQALQIKSERFVE